MAKVGESLSLDSIFGRLPSASRHLLSEVTILMMSNIVDFHARLALMLDYVVSQGGKLEGDVVTAIDGYLRQALDKEFASEDESSSLRARLIEALAGLNKDLALEHMRDVHETSLANLKKVAHLDDLETALKSISSIVFRENERPEFVAGLQHAIKFRDGTVYEGFIKAGKKHGMGKLTFPNGDIYNGGWSKGERHGHGDYIWKSGARYEGNYANNQRNGLGTFKFTDGKVYHGDWKDGLRSGKGKMVWENGDVYEGDFLSSFRTGKGVFKR